METYRQLPVHGKAEQERHGIPSAMLRGVAWAMAALWRIVSFALLQCLDWSDRVIYLAALGVQAAILARVFLKVEGADANKLVPHTIYAVSDRLIAPLAAHLHVHPLQVWGHVLEPVSLVALFAYIFGAYLAVVVVNLVKRVV